MIFNFVENLFIFLLLMLCIISFLQVICGVAVQEAICFLSVFFFVYLLVAIEVSLKAQFSGSWWLFWQLSFNILRIGQRFNFLVVSFSLGIVVLKPYPSDISCSRNPMLF